MKLNFKHKDSSLTCLCLLVMSIALAIHGLLVTVAPGEGAHRQTSYQAAPCACEINFMALVTPSLKCFSRLSYASQNVITAFNFKKCGKKNLENAAEAESSVIALYGISRCKMSNLDGFTLSACLAKSFPK